MAPTLLRGAYAPVQPTDHPGPVSPSTIQSTRHNSHQRLGATANIDLNKFLAPASLQPCQWPTSSTRATLARAGYTCRRAILNHAPGKPVRAAILGHAGAGSLMSSRGLFQATGLFHAAGPRQALFGRSSMRCQE
eukprot:scaffold33642_cov150-Isochrysis_galbana.AAC.2